MSLMETNPITSELSETGGIVARNCFQDSFFDEARIIAAAGVQAQMAAEKIVSTFEQSRAADFTLEVSVAWVDSAAKAKEPAKGKKERAKGKVTEVETTNVEANAGSDGEGDQGQS